MTSTIKRPQPFTDAQVYDMLEEMYRRGWNARVILGDNAWETDAEYICVTSIHQLFTMAEQGKFGLRE